MPEAQCSGSASHGSNHLNVTPVVIRRALSRALPEDAGSHSNLSARRNTRVGWCCFAIAHIGGSAAGEEVVARRGEEIDHLGVLAEPCLVLRTSWDDHDITWAADPLFGAEAELHLSLEHPHNLLVCMTVRLNMDASLDAPPYEHSLITGENAAADLFADLLPR